MLPVLAFAGFSVAIHAAVFLRFDGAASAGGESGTTLVTLQAAPDGYADMVRDWKTPPETVAEMDMPAPPRPAVRSRQSSPVIERDPTPNRVIPTALQPMQDPAPAPEKADPPPLLNATNIATVATPEPHRPSEHSAAAPSRTAPPTLPRTSVTQDAPDVQGPPDAPGVAPVYSSTHPMPRPSRPASTPQVAQRASGQGTTALAGTANSPAAARNGDANAAALQARWAGRIQSEIARHQAYPRGNHGAGRVKVTMVILASGELQQAALTASSGRLPLDRAALRAVERAAPFPPAPEGLPRKSYRFAQWMNFEPR